MWSYVSGCKDLYNKHVAIDYKHFLHLHVIMLLALFDWMQRVSTAINKNPYLVSPKFYLNPPRVKRTGVNILSQSTDTCIPHPTCNMNILCHRTDTCIPTYMYTNILACYIDILCHKEQIHFYQQPTCCMCI